MCIIVHDCHKSGDEHYFVATYALLVIQSASNINACGCHRAFSSRSNAHLAKESSTKHVPSFGYVTKCIFKNSVLAYRTKDREKNIENIES